MEIDIMKTKTVAVIAGALTTIFLWAIAFVILNGVYRGNFPWLLTVLAAFLCPLIGGYVVARLEHTKTARLGALSGGGAGLGVLLVAATISSITPNATLAGIGLLVVGMLGGGLGTLVTRSWFFRKKQKNSN
jgi:hypothetical protein